MHTENWVVVHERTGAVLHNQLRPSLLAAQVALRDEVPDGNRSAWSIYRVELRPVELEPRDVPPPAGKGGLGHG